MSPPSSPERPRLRSRTVAIIAAAVVAVMGIASAAVSAYWALGGTALLDTVGGEIEEWGRRRSTGVALALWTIVTLKLVGAIAPLVLVGVGASRLPAWTRGRRARWLGWVTAAGLTVYGGARTIVGLLVESGVIEASADADERALAWHAFVWDPWFAVWGIAFVIALRREPQPASRRG